MGKQSGHKIGHTSCPRFIHGSSTNHATVDDASSTALSTDHLLRTVGRDLHTGEGPESQELERREFITILIIHILYRSTRLHFIEPGRRYKSKPSLMPEWWRKSANGQRRKADKQ